MKSKSIRLDSSNNARTWDCLLKKEQKNIFLQKYQSKAVSLMNQDSKVHMKEIGNSTYKLLVYAGYADSRPSATDNNRDSNQKLSITGSVK